MTTLAILFAICVALMFAAVVRPRLIYEYPYFMAATFCSFIIPQAYALVRTEWVPPLTETTLRFAVLCIAACSLAYLPRHRSQVIDRLNVPLNPSRFFHAGIAFVFIAFVFNHLIELLPEEEKGSMWTGRVTIYAFFGQLIYPGFAICFYTAVQRRDALAWITAVVAATIPIELAVVYARREATVLFLLTLLMTVFFLKRKTPPGWVILLGVIAMALFIPATSQYRTMAQEDALAAIRDIDFHEGFKQFFDEEGVSEVKNATIVIAATQLTADYELGAGYWNRIVFRFVPAQILGENFKNSLMIGGHERNLGDFVEDAFAFKVPMGSTVTGLADSFNQFGYFGCLVFAAISYLFKNLWAAAYQPNGTVAQILYIQITTSAMRALTHQTIDFLPGFLYSAIFIWLVAVYAAERKLAPSPMAAKPIEQVR